MNVNVNANVGLDLLIRADNQKKKVGSGEESYDQGKVLGEVR